MSEVSLFRLYLMRAAYAVIVLGLAAMIWPGLLTSGPSMPHMSGVVSSLLAGVSILALIGIRYPLAMLPVLLFELVWKAIWLILIALPLWHDGALDPARTQTAWDCLFGVVLTLVVIPWNHVFERFVRSPGERWTNRRG